MRRRRSLRLAVAVVMVAVATISLVTVAAVNFVVTDDLLERQATDELEALQRSRADAIADGIHRRREAVAIAAADLGVVSATTDFVAAVDALGAAPPALTEAERAAVIAAYADLTANDTLTAAVAAAGLDVPSLAELLPADPVAEFLQYHYVLRGGVLSRSAADDGGERGAGSPYAAVHERHASRLGEIATRLGADDVLLVATDGTSRIVYSTSGGIELGAAAMSSVVGGRLGPVLAGEIARTPIGDGAVVDVHSYLGAGGQPVMFIAAAVRDGREVVGVLAARFPIDPLNSLMTADGRWRDVGLGETGETYVVGRDLSLRSDARTWIEDREQHLRSLRSRGLGDVADAVEALGTTVLVERVDTEPVRRALEGMVFVGRATGPRGVPVLSVASPLGVPGLDWVVVAELERAEATSESADQLRRLLVLAALLIPVAAVCGVVLARRITRPVPPLVDAAEAVANGERSIALDDRSSDEFGHLARSLVALADRLAHDDAELEAQYRAVDELLGSVLPARVIEAVRSGELEFADLVDTATVIALTVEGLPELGEITGQSERDAAEGTAAISAVLEELAAELAVERVWASADRHVFLAGLGRADHGCDDAVNFVRSIPERLSELAADLELRIAIHAGLAAGTVATGVVGGDHLSFGAWGPAASEALALDAVASDGDVLVHASVIERMQVSVRTSGTRAVEVDGARLDVVTLDVGSSTSRA